MRAKALAICEPGPASLGWLLAAGWRPGLGCRPSEPQDRL